MDEKRLWMEAALTVPEALLHVGTSEGVDLKDADTVESPSSTTARGSVSEASEDGYDFGVLLPTTCGLEHTLGTPLFTAVDGEQSYRFGGPFHPAGGGDRCFGAEVASEPAGGAGSDEIKTPAYDERVHDTLIDDAGFDLWANLLASTLGPDGPFATAHREITRLIALHAEAGHVLARCAAALCHDVPNAHVALQSLGSAASATATAEDFLRWRYPGSPRRKEWGPWRGSSWATPGAARAGADARRCGARLLPCLDGHQARSLLIAVSTAASTLQTLVQSFMFMSS